jgi:hypothetical protein
VYIILSDADNAHNAHNLLRKLYTSGEGIIFQKELSYINSILDTANLSFVATS